MIGYKDIWYLNHKLNHDVFDHVCIVKVSEWNSQSMYEYYDHWLVCKTKCSDLP